MAEYFCPKCRTIFDPDSPNRFGGSDRQKPITKPYGIVCYYCDYILVPIKPRGEE